MSCYDTNIYKIARLKAGKTSVIIKKSDIHSRGGR